MQFSVVLTQVVHFQSCWLEFRVVYSVIHWWGGVKTHYNCTGLWKHLFFFWFVFNVFLFIVKAIRCRWKVDRYGIRHVAILFVGVWVSGHFWMMGVCFSQYNKLPSFFFCSPSLLFCFPYFRFSFVCAVCQDNVGQVGDFQELNCFLLRFCYRFDPHTRDFEFWPCKIASPIRLLSGTKCWINKIPLGFFWEFLLFGDTICSFGWLSVVCEWFSKMSKFEGVIVSDQWLQSQFTQVELRTLKSKVSSFH